MCHGGRKDRTVGINIVASEYRVLIFFNNPTPQDGNISMMKTMIVKECGAVTCRWGGPIGGGIPPGGGIGGMLGSKGGRANGGRGGGPLIIPKGGGGGLRSGGGPLNTGVCVGAGAGAGPRNRTACCAILAQHNKSYS